MRWVWRGSEERGEWRPLVAVEWSWAEVEREGGGMEMSGMAEDLRLRMGLAALSRCFSSLAFCSIDAVARNEKEVDSDDSAGEATPTPPSDVTGGGLTAEAEEGAGARWGRSSGGAGGGKDVDDGVDVAEADADDGACVTMNVGEPTGVEEVEVESRLSAVGLYESEEAERREEELVGRELERTRGDS